MGALFVLNLLYNFLETLREANILIRLGPGDSLECDAPKGVMTEKIKNQIRLYKPAIIDFLKHTQTNKWSSLVPLKTDGSKRPFFCFHEVGGNVLHYSTLAEYLPFDQPFYGFQSQGLDGITPPFQSIQEMVNHYLDELRTFQPKGPYYLGGGSMGGNLAFEVAQQLKSYGETIGLLIMFDSIGPNITSKDERKTNISRNILGKLRRFSPRKTKLSFLAMKLTDKINFYLKMRQCKMYIRKKEHISHELRYWCLTQQNHKALRKHKYEPYDGEIILVRSDMKEEGSMSLPNRGWEGIVSKLTIKPIPSQHNNLIEQPELGHYLNQVLQQHQKIHS